MVSGVLYTIGHGARAAAELVDMLEAHGIAVLVDIRAQPRSRRHPQFDQGALREALEARGLHYRWAGRQLGGRRPEQPRSPHRALPEGLRGFADYMDSEDFARAAAQLQRLAARAPAAMLCAADYLALRGVQVVHLIGPGVQRAHSLHPGARRASQRLVYDRASGTLDLH